MLAVDGNAARMTEKETESTLLKPVLGRKGMKLVLVKGGIEHRPVKVAGMVGNKYGRPGKNLILA